MAPRSSPRRGRPRDDARRLRVLHAAMACVADDPGHVTFERIAAQAQVSRTTLYRWWGGPHDLVLEALVEATQWSLQHTVGSARERLRDQVADLIEIMTTAPTAAVVRFVASGSAADPATRQRFAQRWLEPRRAVAANILHAGIADGSVRTDIDEQVVIDALFAPIYHRAFFTSHALEDTLADAVMSAVWPGICAQV